MSGYQGMRWFKCDLQVQTPEDGRHWDSEDPLRLAGNPSQRDEQDLQEKARRYLRRCHEVGLEVIGVTDHNFCSHRLPRKRFLAHLIEQNRAVARDLGREPLWIFPGFEVDIGYHVLCLFPPERTSSSRLDAVCDVLTKLGLPPSGRFDGHGAVPLRRDGREVSLSEVLRIVQEEHGGIVIAAHAFQDDGIASESRGARDYQNENLLCVEVASFPLRDREQAVLEAKAGVWFRPRPLAYIRSSDAKSTLLDAEGNPRPNSLGYRSTWIKMSEPSIEALRQAFLDWKSRIRLEGDPRIVRHDRIASLSIQGVAFLADQEVNFSPHFNCLIGGRGSGKSSLLEYVRFAVRREDDPAAREQAERIRATFKPDSVLRLVWREQDDSVGTPGPEDVFEYHPSAGRSRVVSREVADAPTVFQALGIQIFSQREITEIAKTPDFLLSLVDRLVGPRLQALRQREVVLRDKIRHHKAQQQTLQRLQSEERSLEQEVQELDRRWAARAAVQEEQKRHRAAQEAARYLESASEKAISLAGDLDQWASNLVESHPSQGSVVQSWPESSFFEALDTEIEKAKQALAEEIRQAASCYRDRIADLTVRSPAWGKVQDSIREAEEAFRAACSRQGLRPEDLEQLFQLDLQRKAKSLELEAKRSQATEIGRSIQDLVSLQTELLAVWREQTNVRREEIDRILSSQAIPKVPRRVEGGVDGERPTLEVRIDFEGDRNDFLRQWSELAPDARTRLGRQWEELGEDAFKAFTESPDRGSPWLVVQAWLDNVLPFPLQAPDALPALREHLLERRREAWDAKILTRIRDAVDVVLFRSDGTEAGSLSRRQLSEGQTNTAVLMLLLASGKGPILIDQPEDELDSNFISQQLVPLLREIKNERQVIVATHNPNFPVNGDAEIVYALQAEALGNRARGVVRAQGGLDREEVKNSVLDIMEGSEEAFRQRSEKYHF